MRLRGPSGQAATVTGDLRRATSRLWAREIPMVMAPNPNLMRLQEALVGPAPARTAPQTATSPSVIDYYCLTGPPSNPRASLNASPGTDLYDD